MQTKVCKTCLKELPETDFYLTDKRRGYRRTTCKACDAITTKAYYHSHPETRAKVAARSVQWAKNNRARLREIARKSSIRTKYGLEPEDYEALRSAQDNRCAICQSEDTGRTSGKWANGYWHVDHCHETNRVRGLLCHGCNVRLGGMERLLKDRPIEWLLAYIKGPAECPAQSPVPPTSLGAARMAQRC